MTTFEKLNISIKNFFLEGSQNNVNVAYINLCIKIKNSRVYKFYYR